MNETFTVIGGEDWPLALFGAVMILLMGLFSARKGQSSNGCLVAAIALLVLSYAIANEWIPDRFSVPAIMAIGFAGVHFDVSKLQNIRTKSLWTAASFILVFGFYTAISWRTSGHRIQRIELTDTLLSFVRRNGRTDQVRAKVRVVEFHGHSRSLSIKDGISDVSIYYDRFRRSDGDVIDASELIASIEKWTGRPREHRSIDKDGRITQVSGFRR